MAFAQAIALAQPLQLLALVAVHQPDLAAQPFQARFKQQRHHQHHCRCAGQLRQSRFKAGPHDRVHQLLQPLALLAIGENDSPQGGPIDPCPRTGTAHCLPVAIQHGCCGLAARGQGLAGQDIRIENGQAPLRQQPAHAALARGNAAGEADAALLAWGA